MADRHRGPGAGEVRPEGRRAPATDAAPALGAGTRACGWRRAAARRGAAATESQAPRDDSGARRGPIRRRSTWRRACSRAPRSRRPALRDRLVAQGLPARDGGAYGRPLPGARIRRATSAWPSIGRARSRMRGAGSLKIAADLRGARAARGAHRRRGRGVAGGGARGVVGAARPGTRGRSPGRAGMATARVAWLRRGDHRGAARRARLSWCLGPPRRAISTPEPAQVWMQHQARLNCTSRLSGRNPSSIAPSADRAYHYQCTCTGYSYRSGCSTDHRPRTHRTRLCKRTTLRCTHPSSIPRRRRSAPPRESNKPRSRMDSRNNTSARRSGSHPREGNSRRCCSGPGSSSSSTGRCRHSRHRAQNTCRTRGDTYRSNTDRLRYKQHRCRRSNYFQCESCQATATRGSGVYEQK